MNIYSAAGPDLADATCSQQHAPTNFAEGLLAAGHLGSQPLKGKRLGLVTQTMGEGVQPAVQEALLAATKHLESLGAVVEEVGGVLGIWVWCYRDLGDDAGDLGYPHAPSGRPVGEDVRLCGVGGVGGGGMQQGCRR